MFKLKIIITSFLFALYLNALNAKFTFDIKDSLISLVPKRECGISKKLAGFADLKLSLDNQSNSGGPSTKNADEIKIVHKLKKFINLPLLKEMINEETIFKRNHKYFNKLNKTIIIRLKENKNILSLRKLESSIILIVKSEGDIQYLGYSFYNNLFKPDGIYVNDSTTNKNRSYELQGNFQYETKITIIYKKTIISCNSMFSYCQNILSIDLSNFDSSQVTIMNYMFQNCNKLVSINFTNFNTKNVKEMKYIFDLCSDLSSIDLSMFNTEQVTLMEAMFQN